MAECTGSRLSAYHHYFGLITADMSDWTKSQDSAIHNNKRAQIIYAVMDNHSTGHLRKILDSGWDVNEVLNMKLDLTDPWSTTALERAIVEGWTEGVKMLFDVGANYGSVSVPGRPCLNLKLAIVNPHCSVDLVALLLKHGANPNVQSRWLEDRPLVQAILHSSPCNEIVQLLLENGADPNGIGKLHLTSFFNIPLSHQLEDADDDEVCPLYAVLAKFGCSAACHFELGRDVFLHNDEIKARAEENAELFKIMATYGADVNWTLHYNWSQPLLHKMLLVLHPTPRYVESLYLEEHLDVFFQNGGNIRMQNCDHETALEYAVRGLGHSNSIRWMIRHGACVHSTMFVRLERYFIPDYEIHQLLFEKTPLILLQAGMRVSKSAYTYLMEMAESMSTREEEEQSHVFQDKVERLWDTLLWRDRLEKLEKNPDNCKCREYLDTQLADLEEFSDESLQVYPKTILKWWQRKDKVKCAVEQIHQVLEFLSQPQSLQWYCRRCVRENLVSPSPSAVKTLPVAGKLKRYILCHEI